MRTAFLLSFSLFLCSIISAQKSYQNRLSPFPAFVEINEELETQHAQRWLKHHFQLGEDFSILSYQTENDPLGFVHQRFQQYHKDIPVKAGTWIVHSKQAKIQSMNGHLFDLRNLEEQNLNISKSEAIQIALNEYPASLYRWEIDPPHSTKTPAEYYPNPKLVYTTKDLNYAAPNFRLTYELDLYAIEPHQRNLIYIDVSTGEILATQSRIYHTDGTAETAYSGTQSISTDSLSPTNFRLRDYSRGNGILTYDLNNSTNISNGVDFTDTDNYWNNVNADQDEVATDAHWGLQETYDYFLNTHGRDSYDNNGKVITSYIHYGSNSTNASWNDDVMTYGDGANASTINSPLTCLDIVAHELTHGYTEYTADLIYQDQSGALNESFSDIFAVVIDFHSRPAQANWRLADEVSSNGLGNRNMANPNDNDDPDTYLGTYWYSGSADYGGVHINSGVQNFWFYLLSQGGNGSNDLGNPYTVNAIGMDDAAAIAYRSLTVYLSQLSEYVDARFYSIQAAKDLFGDCAPQVIETTNAWHAVGLGDPYNPFFDASFVVDQTQFCSPPASVNFNGLSNAVSAWFWDFGDGNTSSDQLPTHTYTQYGSFNVKLVSTSCTGAQDSIIQYQLVEIDSTFAICNAHTMTQTGMVELTACNGQIFDPGGPTGNYPGNTNSTVVINPPSNQAFDLVFSVFETENNYDILSIYDGPDINAPLIGDFSGNNLPNGGTITATNGALTLVMDSDGVISGDGFAAQWECTLAVAPEANFIAQLMHPCSLSVLFTDLSDGADSWLWNFGDGNTSTMQNPTHNYVSAGQYNVNLEVTNTFGTDNHNSSVQINAFTGDINAPATAEQFEVLQFNTTSGDSWLWDFGDGNTSTLQNPTHAYNNSGNYVINLTASNAANCEDNLTAILTVDPYLNLDINANKNRLEISPNPASNISHLRYQFEGQKELELRIYNSAGQIIKQQYYQQTNLLEETINLPAGIYLIHLRDGNQYYTKRLIFSGATN